MTWITNEEVNSSYFIIERSGKIFNREIIGTLKNKKQEDLQEYEFEDSVYNIVITDETKQMLTSES